MLFNELKEKDLSKVFVDLNLNEFEMGVNQQNGNIVLFNRDTGAVIDRAIHAKICGYLRKMLNITRVNKKPANEEARKYMLERAKQKLSRQKRKKSKISQLEKHIISLVNTSEFPYDYETVLDISIYQFNCSVQQVARKIRFDKLMIGCYAGTVNIKELNQDELNWIAV